MTHFNHKEEEFKKILGDLELGIDTDSLWNELEHRLPQDKRDDKLPLAIWFLGAFFLVGMLGLLIIGPDQLPEAPIYSEEQKLNTDNEEKGIYAAVKEYEQAIEKVIEEKTKSESINYDYQLESTTNSIASSSNSNRTISQLSHTNTKTSHQPIINSISNNSHSSDLDPTRSEAIPETTASSTLHRTLSIEQDLSESARLSIKTLPPLAILRSAVRHDSSRDLAIGNQLQYSRSIEPLAQKKWVPNYSLLFGPNIGQTAYASVSDSNQSFESRDPLNEIALPGFSSQLSYGITKNGWQLEVALSYSLLAARHIDDELEVTTRETNSATGGSISESTIFQNDIRLHRIHHNLDLGLGIGRVLFANEKYKLSTALMANYNVYSMNSGYYQDVSAMTVTKLDDTSEEIYKGNNGVGGQINLTIERRLFKRTSLMIRPYYSRYLSPINRNSTSFKIENSQVGLLIGISYRPVWE